MLVLSPFWHSGAIFFLSFWCYLLSVILVLTSFWHSGAISLLAFWCYLLYDIQVLSSSGYAVLDEAAMKIVRLAAPFAPFPAELRATTDKLEIIRTWQFQENRLSSG